MDRRKFLNTLFKGAAAATGQSVMPKGVVGSIVKNITSSNPLNINNTVKKWMELSSIIHHPPIDNNKFWYNSIEQYKNLLSSFTPILAKSMPKYTNFEQSLTRSKDQAIDLLTKLQNTKHPISFDYYLENVPYILHTYDLPHFLYAGNLMDKDLENYFMNYDPYDKIYPVRIIQSRELIKRKKEISEDEALEILKKEYPDKYKPAKDYIDEERRDIEEYEYRRNSSSIPYSRMDYAGGSEDTDYAQTFESFFYENYADGKKPGRKGLAKRSGVNCKQSVSKLRKIAKSSSGERQRMAHWCANMKSGKKKK